MLICGSLSIDEDIYTAHEKAENGYDAGYDGMLLLVPEDDDFSLWVDLLLFAVYLYLGLSQDFSLYMGTYRRVSVTYYSPTFPS